MMKLANFAANDYAISAGPADQRILLVSGCDATAERLSRILSIIPYTTFVLANPAELSARLNLDTQPAAASGAWELLVFAAGPGAGLAEGMQLLLQMQSREAHCAAVVVAERPTLEQAVLAMRTGCTSVLDIASVEAGLRQAVEQGLKKTAVLRAIQQQRVRDKSALQMAQSRLSAMESQVAALQQTTLDALLSSLEVRERNARVHSQRLTAYATHLATVIGYPASLLPHLQSACMLHDIGKLELDYELLNNPGVLPAAQLEALRPHTWLGERILNGVPFLRPAARMVRHHHERWDGSGYPDNLVGENIPLGSRIIAIVDTLDAITNEQTYRPAQPFKEAIAEIIRWSARQFDPQLSAEFRRIQPKVWETLREQVEAGTWKDSADVSAPAKFPPQPQRTLPIVRSVA